MTNEDRNRLREYVLERILKDKVSGCWVWQLSQGSHGYGQGSQPAITGRQVSVAHRLSYLGFSGDIPEGYQIDHLCRNRLCCNPKHLEAVSQHLNIRRQFGLSENLEKCAHGHVGRMARNNRGHLFCHECRLDVQRRYRAKKAA